MIKGHDAVKLIYQINVKLDIGLGNVVLNDVLEYIVNVKDVLTKIPEFEAEAKKREEELKEKAMKLTEITKKLESMGYAMVEQEIVDRNPVITYHSYSNY